jgi:hypothetical protein
MVNNEYSVRVGTKTHLKEIRFGKSLDAVYVMDICSVFQLFSERIGISKRVLERSPKKFDHCEVVAITLEKARGGEL